MSDKELKEIEKNELSEMLDNLSLFTQLIDSQ
jgi:hypothetical protein